MQAASPVLCPSFLFAYGFFCLGFPPLTLIPQKSPPMKVLVGFEGLLTSSPSLGHLQHGYKPPSYSHISFFPHLNLWTLLPEAHLRALGQKPAFLAHPFFLSLQTLELGLDRIVKRFICLAAPSGPTGSCCSIYRKRPDNEKMLKL